MTGELTETWHDTATLIRVLADKNRKHNNDSDTVVGPLLRTAAETANSEVHELLGAGGG